MNDIIGIKRKKEKDNLLELTTFKRYGMKANVKAICYWVLLYFRSPILHEEGLSKVSEMICKS